MQKMVIGVESVVPDWAQGTQRAQGAQRAQGRQRAQGTQRAQGRQGRDGSFKTVTEMATPQPSFRAPATASLYKWSPLVSPFSHPAHCAHCGLTPRCKTIATSSALHWHKGTVRKDNIVTIAKIRIE